MDNEKVSAHINTYEFLESEVTKYEQSDKSDPAKTMDSGNWLKWAITGRAKLPEPQSSELRDRVIAVQVAAKEMARERGVSIERFERWKKGAIEIVEEANDPTKRQSCVRDAGFAMIYVTEHASPDQMETIQEILSPLFKAGAPQNSTETLHPAA